MLVSEVSESESCTDIAQSTVEQQGPRQDDDDDSELVSVCSDNDKVSRVIDSKLSESSSFEKQHNNDSITMVASPSSSSTSTIGRGHLADQAMEWVIRELERWQHRSPLIGSFVTQARRVSPRWRIAFVSVWILWKLLMTILTISFFLAARHGTAGTDTSTGIIQQQEQQLVGATSSSTTKVLYIVTSLAEYDNGHRATVKGRDRFAELMLPCIIDSIESIISHPHDFDVDLYLITAWEVRPERLKMIQDRLPKSVGLEVWDDACPLGYSKETGRKKVFDNTRALSRQHRFVLRDKLEHYDLFLPFEDDMRITGAHLQHYIAMSNEIERLWRQAPETLPGVPENMDGRHMKFYGGMTRDQLKRVVPGLVRVEVLVNETLYGAQKKLDPIPLDYHFGTQEHHFDPTVCCHVPNLEPNMGVPERPNPLDVIIWETQAKALSLRHMPGSDLFEWVILMPGPGKRMKKDEHIGGYWAGRNNEFGDIKKPSGGVPDLIGQQGGWIATRKQLVRMNDELCMGRFLPPFDEPIYYEDGQQSMNVEFWSGGYQYFTGVRGGCNMQRILSFDPADFSKHFLYHMANNKQKQLKTERMLRADHLLAQMNTILKKAQKEKEASSTS